MKLNNILVVVVTYNGSNYIEKCIDSLISSALSVDILVIDNASIDNTVEIINKKYPSLSIFCNKINLGFALANNIGIRHAIELNYDFVFLLNQDTVIDKFAIQHLFTNFTCNSNLAILSPVHLNYDGTKFENKFSEYIQEPYCNTFLSNLYFNRPKEITETLFVNAAAWFVPVNIFSTIGGFDPIFFHYGEDIDFVQRCQKKGLKIAICPSSIIFHDAKELLWKDIMWNRQRMVTLYISELKNIKSSYRSNILIFIKKRFNELTDCLVYRQFRLFFFRMNLVIYLIFKIPEIYISRKKSFSVKPFL